MARLNALFPAVVLLGDEDDFDPSPYSPGLRDSIRFSVFEHLVGRDPNSEKQQQLIQMKLLSWCNIPGYDQAREALVRYMEESLKLEQVCLGILHSIERNAATTPKRKRRASSAVNTSQVSSGDTSRDSHSSKLQASPDRRPIPKRARPAPPASEPLLRGMPGREISGAKVDGAAFAGDLRAPPILSYPYDLSRTRFDEHPLAKDLEMSTFEKASLGLIIPKEVKSRNF